MGVWECGGVNRSESGEPAADKRSEVHREVGGGDEVWEMGDGVRGMGV